MDLKVLTTQAAKRQQLKDCKVSPDGFLQMSFQLAYHKLYKKTATTYESASTSAYKHGRTEVIRSATPQSVLFTQAFSSPSATAEEKAKLLRNAVDHHSKITVEALMGKGWGPFFSFFSPRKLVITRSCPDHSRVDRHLFALRSYAQKHGDVPAIFKDRGILNFFALIQSVAQLTPLLPLL